MARSERSSGCKPINLNDEEYQLTVNQITRCESAGQPVHPQYCSSPALFTMIGSCKVPTRSDGKGLMSKMSTPSILPRISRRSRPVDCSRSVGTVPGAAPSGRRSASEWMSVRRHIFSSVVLQASFEDSEGV